MRLFRRRRQPTTEERVEIALRWAGTYGLTTRMLEQRLASDGRETGWGAGELARNFTEEQVDELLSRAAEAADLSLAALAPVPLNYLRNQVFFAYMTAYETGAPQRLA